MFCEMTPTAFSSDEVREFASEKEAHEVIGRAMEDYEAVLRFEKPVHAKEVATDIHIFDGGTTDWQGAGYSLEIRKRLCTLGLGSEKYFSYGPIIVLDSRILRGDESVRTISCVRLYSAKELKQKLKKEPNQAPEPTPTTVTPPAGQEARQP